MAWLNPIFRTGIRVQDVGPAKRLPTLNSTDPVPESKFQLGARRRSAIWILECFFDLDLGIWIFPILLLLTTGCRRDMFNQPYSKPLERSDFFQDNHMASRPLVQHTVARGHLNDDQM